MKKGNVLDALNKAIEMEEKGHKFYMELAEKSKNDITKNAFIFLADSEVYHIKSIKEFSNALKETGKLPELEIENKQRKRTQDFVIFSTSIEDLKNPDKKQGR